MVANNEDHPGTGESNGEAPPVQIPVKTQIIAMIEHMLMAAKQGDVIGASLILAQRDGVPQHGYIAGPFAAAVMIGGYEMAKSDLVDAVRQPLPPKVTG
jgi:hypothetical protein